jgi:serine/threonine protein kinase
MREIVKPGDVVEGRYKILKHIAEGGMGTVFLAEHWLIKRRVALKFLHRELASDATAIRRFMNEAHAAGTLGHPNIVESTDMGFYDDVPYIVYEWVDGILLATEIQRVGPLSVGRTLEIAWQIAAALDAAHEADIVHRDLKSDNVFLTKRPDTDDHVKVLDFGISRFITASDRTAAGANLIGTPEFMAPEQVLSPENIDKRVDVYALGVMLYEMLSGHVPFVLERRPGAPQPDIEAAHALLARIINEPPPPLGREGTPAGLGEVIRDKLLAKDPARRYASMKHVQGALEAFASVLPGGRIGASRRRTPTAPPPVDREISGNLMEPIQIAREVKALGKRWLLAGPDLQADVHHESMARLASIVSAAATIGDELSHHPMVELRVPRLRITIPGVGRVVDLVLAARIEHWLRSNGW